MKATDGLFQLLLTVLFLVVRASGDDYIHLSVLGDDLVSVDDSRARTDNRARTARGARRFVVKRASLDEQSRPSAVEETLNSLRRQKHAANMYYVVRSYSLSVRRSNIR